MGALDNVAFNPAKVTMPAGLAQLDLLEGMKSALKGIEERSRYAEEKARQDKLDKMKFDEYNRQKNERVAKDIFNKTLLSEDEYVPGAITDTFVKGGLTMPELTPEEIAKSEEAASKYGADRYMGELKWSNPNIYNKLKAQENIGNQLMLDDSFKETAVDKITRATNAAKAKGFVTDDMVNTLFAAREAEKAAYKAKGNKAKEDLLKLDEKIFDIGEKLSKSKSTPNTSDKGAGRASTGLSSSTASIVDAKSIADKYNLDPGDAELAFNKLRDRLEAEGKPALKVRDLETLFKMNADPNAVFNWGPFAAFDIKDSDKDISNMMRSLETARSNGYSDYDTMFYDQQLKNLKAKKDFLEASSKAYNGSYKDALERERTESFKDILNANKVKLEPTKEEIDAINEEINQPSFVRDGEEKEYNLDKINELLNQPLLVRSEDETYSGDKLQQLLTGKNAGGTTDTKPETDIKRIKDIQVKLEDKDLVPAKREELEDDKERAVNRLKLQSLVNHSNLEKSKYDIPLQDWLTGNHDLTWGQVGDDIVDAGNTLFDTLGKVTSDPLIDTYQAVDKWQSKYLNPTPSGLGGKTDPKTITNPNSIGPVPTKVKGISPENVFRKDNFKDAGAGQKLDDIPNQEIEIKGLGSANKDVKSLAAKASPLLVDREGIRESSYKDSLGNLTGGIGHLLTKEEQLKYPEGTKIPQEQVDKWYAEDIGKATKAALRQSKELGVDNEEFKKVLVSVNFQLGTNWKSKFPNTYKLIKAGRYDEAKANLNSSLWAKQTPTRVKDLIETINMLS
jgi:GH24 family phage-related lysozyme (muramidase)